MNKLLILLALSYGGYLFYENKKKTVPKGTKDPDKVPTPSGGGSRNVATVKYPMFYTSLGSAGTSFIEDKPISTAQQRMIHINNIYADQLNEIPSKRKINPRF